MSFLEKPRRLHRMRLLRLRCRVVSGDATTFRSVATLSRSGEALALMDAEAEGYRGAPDATQETPFPEKPRPGGRVRRRLGRSRGLGSGAATSTAPLGKCLEEYGKRKE